MQTKTRAASTLWRSLSLIGVAILALTIGACNSKPAYPAPKFVSADCTIQVPSSVNATCGTVAVPRDRSNSASGTFKLSVIVFHSTASTPAKDPVVYLAGGPGENAVEESPYVYSKLFAPFVAERDVVLFDQRGAGASEPNTDCPELDTLTVQQLNDAINSPAAVDTANQQFVDVVAACRQRLNGAGVDLADLSTAASARDVGDIMRALGYTQWDLLGVSYGTKLAQAVMRDAPDGVRAVIMDSVVPNGADMIAQTPGSFSRALQALFDACAADQTCSNDYPNLKDTLLKAVAVLNANPIAGTVTNQSTFAEHPALATGVDLGNELFQALYSSDMIPILPDLIKQAASGDAAYLDLLEGMDIANAQFISTGMQLTLECKEDAAYSSEQKLADASAPFTLVQQMIGGTRPVGSEIFDACAKWDVGKAPNSDNQPVTSDLPTIVFAGHFDPITPPAGSKQVADSLPNGQYVEVPTAGHAALTDGTCPTSIAVAFLDNPSAKADTSCLQDNPTVQWARPIPDTQFQPFSSSVAGIQGLAPTGWVQVFPGSYSRSGLGLVSILQSITPSTTGADMMNLVAGSVPGGGTPSEIAPLTTPSGETWHVFHLSVAGQVLLIAYDGDGKSVPFIVISGLANQEQELRQYLLTPLTGALKAYSGN